MRQETLAVLGGGNGAHMMAAHMALEGHKVNMIEHPCFEAGFRAVLQNQSIEASGIGPQGVATLNLATTDFAEGLAGVRWIHLVMSAPGHEFFFEEMLPHLRDGQNVVVWAGNFSAVRLYRLLCEAKAPKGIRVFETNTIPYGTRLRGPGKIELLLWGLRVRIAGMPAKINQSLVEELKGFFPQLERAPNVLATAFDNPNPTVHPPASLLNVGRIQYSQGEFYLYREGLTEAVARVIRQVFDEGVAVAEKYGTELIQYRDEDFRTTTSVMGVEFVAPFDTVGVIANVKGPSSLNDRYIREDIPFGLVPRSQLGRKVGVHTPVIDAIINLGSSVCSEDFWKTGRTLESIGLADLESKQILDYLTEGVKT